MGDGVDGSSFGTNMALIGSSDTATGTHYTPTAYGALAANAVEAMHRGGVVYLYSHCFHLQSDVQSLNLGYPSWVERILASNCAQVPQALQQSNHAQDIYMIDECPNGYFDDALFVYYHGCHSWSEGSEQYRPIGLIASTLAKGADACAGFKASPQWDQANLFNAYFFYYALECGQPKTVEEAYQAALLEVVLDYWPDLGNVDAFRCTSWDLELKPARWGL